MLFGVKDFRLLQAKPRLTVDRHGATSSTYGNLALLNSTRTKYSTNSMADPAMASASHTSCLMVIPDISPAIRCPPPTARSPKGFPLEPMGRTAKLPPAAIFCDPVDTSESTLSKEDARACPHICFGHT